MSILGPLEASLQVNVSCCPFLALSYLIEIQRVEALSSSVGGDSLAQRVGLPQISCLDCVCSKVYSLPP